MPINTLEFARRMTKAGFTREQAEAQAELFAEMIETDLASKRDLRDVEGALRRDIQELEVNLKRDLKELEPTIKRDLKEIEHKMLQMTVASAVLVDTVIGFMMRFMKPQGLI